MIAGHPVFPFGPSDTPTRHVLRMTSGRLPSLHGAAHPSPELAARPGLLRAIDNELAKALAPDPGDRHVSARELVDAINVALWRLVGPTQPMLFCSG